MDSDKPTQTHSDSLVRRYRGYATMGGLMLGALVGVMVNGPLFYEQAAVVSLAAIGACGAGGALIGYFALHLVPGGLVGGGAGLGSSGGSASSSAQGETGGDGAGGD